MHDFHWTGLRSPWDRSRQLPTHTAQVLTPPQGSLSRNAFNKCYLRSLCLWTSTLVKGWFARCLVQRILWGAWFRANTPRAYSSPLLIQQAGKALGFWLSATWPRRSACQLRTSWRTVSYAIKATQIHKDMGQVVGTTSELAYRFLFSTGLPFRAELREKKKKKKQTSGCPEYRELPSSSSSLSRSWVW